MCVRVCVLLGSLCWLSRSLSNLPPFTFTVSSFLFHGEIFQLSSHFYFFILHHFLTFPAHFPLSFLIFLLTSFFCDRHKYSRVILPSFHPAHYFFCLHLFFLLFMSLFPSYFPLFTSFNRLSVPPFIYFLPPLLMSLSHLYHLPHITYFNKYSCWEPSTSIGTFFQLNSSTGW